MRKVQNGFIVRSEQAQRFRRLVLDLPLGYLVSSGKPPTLFHSNFRYKINILQN